VGIIKVNEIGRAFGDYSYEIYEKVIARVNTTSSPIRSLVIEGENDNLYKTICKWVLNAIPMYSYTDAHVSSSEYGDYMLNDIDWFDTEISQKTIGKVTSSSTEGDTAKDNTTSSESNSNKSDDEVVKVDTNPVSAGIVYSKKQLSNYDFIVSNLYTISGTTYLTKNDFKPLELSNADMTLKQTNNKKPQILIYHTHSQEAFSDSVDGDKSTTIIGVGDYLTKILEEQFGYNVIHNTTSYDLAAGKLDRSAAYDYARDSISKILEENPSIEVVLDIHRDGVKNGTRLVTEINGKSTAQIMFFNGLSRIKDIGDVDAIYNKYLSENLALSLQMKLKALEYYPDLTRKNYLNAYKYNLDLREKSMLIEVGAQTNTLQEAKNAMEPLAVLLDKTLSGK